MRPFWAGPPCKADRGFDLSRKVNRCAGLYGTIATIVSGAVSLARWLSPLFAVLSCDWPRATSAAAHSLPKPAERSIEEVPGIDSNASDLDDSALNYERRSAEYAGLEDIGSKLKLLAG